MEELRNRNISARPAVIYLRTKKNSYRGKNMKTLIERAREAHARMNEETNRHRIEDLRWMIEAMTGTTEFTIYDKPNFVLIIVDGLVLSASYDDESELKLYLHKQCPSCKDMYGFEIEFSHISMLGEAIETEGVCDCGYDGIVELMSTENAVEEMEKWVQKWNERRIEQYRTSTQVKSK